MCPPEPHSSPVGRLAKHTPDSRSWRYAVAGATALAAPVLFYYTNRLIASQWSGTLPSLLVLVGSVLTLLTAAAAPTVLLAPESDAERPQDADTDDSALAELKRQYAAGAVSDDEFEERLETLLSAPDDRATDTDGATREPDRASPDIEAERG